VTSSEATENRELHKRVKLLRFVVQQSTEAWSQAIHTSVGIDEPPFVNGRDVQAPKLSSPDVLRDELEAERQAR